MMTRKDYVETANILKSFSNEIHPQVFEDLVEQFSFYFSSDNERFDKARFETACGIDEIGLIPV
jgi:hypothetical protein